MTSHSLAVLAGLLTAATAVECADFYASPAGRGSGTTIETPCRIADFWPRARPGDTLWLLDGTYTSKVLQVGSETTDTISVSISSNHGAASLAVADTDLVVTSASTASTALSSVNAAIDTVNSSILTVGSLGARLAIKSTALSQIAANTEAAKSQVLDADLAREQLEVVKLQILQQTAIAALSQANIAPQLVLQLLG